MKRSHAATLSTLLTLFPLFPLLTLLTLTTSCSGPRPQKGGRALTTTPGLQQTLQQSDNPSAVTRQTQEILRTRTYTIPGPPSTLSRSDAPTLPRSNAPTLLTLLTLAAPVPVVEREETRARTELGAAQKDTAHELGAKLSSLKGIVWVGVGLFVFGLATIFWAPLRAVVGSLTTSIAITLGGVALMVLPTLIVGNELLILGGVGLAVGAWFLAHRHGHLRGQLTLVAPRPPHKSSSPAEPKSDEGRSSSS